MGLRNLFGDIALEQTQIDILIEHGDKLQEIIIEMKKMNAHLAHITDQRITSEDFAEEMTNADR